MSAANPESVTAANRDALRASASASVAPFAALPATAAASSSSSALPSIEHELATVKRRIAHVEGEITAVETEIVDAKTVRDACTVGSELRQEHTAELQRLGRKEERLRDEKALLLKKEERLHDELKRKELALEREGEYTMRHTI